MVFLYGDALSCPFDFHGGIFAFSTISKALQHQFEHNVVIIAANIDYRNRYYYFGKLSDVISFDSAAAVSYFLLP